MGSVFHNTALKITGMYLAIIMAICILFSVGIYRVSLSEIQRSSRRRPESIQQILNARNPDFRDQFIIEQEQQIKESSQNLRSNLYQLNFVIFILAGGLSYVLAKKSLQPIHRAHESQMRFTADASHELRTPIAAMRLENELLLSDEKLTEKSMRHQLNSNIEELDKLTSLTEGLLTLARSSEGDLSTEKINISSSITPALKRMQATAKTRGVTVEYSATSDPEIEINPAAITEALVTLIDNAIKYSAKGSKVSIKTNVGRKYVSVSVSDKGTGMKAGEMEHVFERFYRGDSSRNKSSADGYGIGLSICESIVLAHNGKVSVKSTPGNGSTFTIHLPV